MTATAAVVETFDPAATMGLPRARPALAQPRVIL